MPPDHPSLPRVGGKIIADRTSVNPLQDFIGKPQDVQGRPTPHVASPPSGRDHTKGEAFWEPFIGHLDGTISEINKGYLSI